MSPNEFVPPFVEISPTEKANFSELVLNLPVFTLRIDRIIPGDPYALNDGGPMVQFWLEREGDDPKLIRMGLNDTFEVNHNVKAMINQLERGPRPKGLREFISGRLLHLAFKIRR